MRALTIAWHWEHVLWLKPLLIQELAMIPITVLVPLFAFTHAWVIRSRSELYWW